MMCRLFGSSNTPKFSIEMVPLIEAVLNSFVMDWGNVLLDKMAIQILDYWKNRYVSTRVVSSFYMSAYIVDTICLHSNFSILGWKWTIHDPTPINV